MNKLLHLNVSYIFYLFRPIQKKTITFSYSFLFFLFLSFSALGQAPGNPNVDAGPDITIDCAAGGCTDINAAFLDIGETDTYTVSQIDYTPPFAFDGLANSLNPNIDDAWSPVADLPFDFCFFGDVITQFQVGSNGVIRFDVDGTDTSNDWSFTDNLPNNSDDALGEANVFLPGHDIDPSASDTEQIGYEVIGTAPNRVLVVAYFEVPMFSGSCNNLLATQMVVFYETTNVIDVYIQDKPVCPSWNDGNAVVGIQNNDGTIAFVPPGRNTSDSPWETTNEAWRFTPAGASVTDFTWMDESGAVIGDTPTINVCPSGTQTYTAQVIYTNCNGDVVTVSDDINVISNQNFTLDLGNDQTLCDGDTFEIVPTLTGNTAGATYLWSTGETTSTITVDTTNTYSLTVTVGSCSTTDSITVTFTDPPTVDLGMDQILCEGQSYEIIPTIGGNTSGATYSWSTGETTPTITVSSSGTYTLTVTVGPCSVSDSADITISEPLSVDLGPDFKSCRNETHTLTATTTNPGVSFQWFLNGDILTGETATTLDIQIPENAMGAYTYSVKISIGTCSATDDLDVTLYDVGNCIISQGISPNGSPGFNDSLDLEFLSDRARGIAKVQIFNRLGTLVFDKTNYINEWRGQAKDGNDLPTGTYFYVIDLNSEDSVYGMQASGWIYLNQDAN